MYELISTLGCRLGRRGWAILPWGILAFFDGVEVLGFGRPFDGPCLLLGKGKGKPVGDFGLPLVRGYGVLESVVQFLADYGMIGLA